MCDDGHIHVSEQRLWQGAWDRRRAHEQKIDLLAFFQQTAALLHPKALLLIRHDHAQVIKLHLILKQRVRPNDDIDLILRQIAQHLLAHRWFQRRAQQLHTDAGIRKQRLQALGVLPREDLGRGQKRALSMRENAATIVLPHPTSPCSMRYISLSDARSSRISAMAVR